MYSNKHKSTSIPSRMHQAYHKQPPRHTDKYTKMKTNQTEPVLTTKAPQTDKTNPRKNYRSYSNLPSES